MVGEVINNYKILSLLGEGGMGAVYLAEHPFMGRKAAIKVLRPHLAEDKGLVERFMNEARAANAIRHPNIIDIMDVGRTPSGVPYLMMELLEGQSVAKRITDADQLGIDEAIEIGTQTASALAAAHAKGIVHRDLKPDNLFLVPDESHPRGVRVKVLDFGIAKLRGDLSNVSAQTQAGALMGTPPYMSPEQCRGLSDEIDHRTDIYALGIILYELLCGAPPFVSQGWGDIVLAHLTKAPPPMRPKNGFVTAELEATIMKALAKTREARFGSMAELQAALRVARATAPATTLSSRPTVDAKGAGSSEPRVTTTFRAAAGEITPDDGSLTVHPRRGRLVGVGVGAAALAVAIFFGRGALHREPPRAPAAAAPAPAPIAAPAVAAPPPPVPTVAPAVEPPAPPTEVNEQAKRTERERTKTRTPRAKASPAAARKPAAPAPAVATPPPPAAPSPKRVEKW